MKFNSDLFHKTDMAITQWMAKRGLLLLYLQMIGTFLPVVLFPHEVFHVFPYSLTMEGQYIVKNVVVLSAGIALGATVRGGRLVPE